MKIRNFEKTDIFPLFSLWNNAFPRECVSKERFYKTIFLEPNFSPDGLFVAEENGSILGYINAVYRRVPIHLRVNIENTGYINAFAIRDDADFMSVGTALLSAAEKYFSDNGNDFITTGYFPLYLNQGVETDGNEHYLTLYQKFGYTVKSSVSMGLPLALYHPEHEMFEQKRRQLSAQGFAFSTLRDEHIFSLLAPDASFSNPSWSREFLSRLSDFDLSRFRICEASGEILGACVFGDPGSDMGRFGPFGVSPKLRGLGIGTILLYDTLCEMQERGIPRAWMQWVSASGAAFHMYEKAGFQIEKNYSGFYKNLKEEPNGISSRN